MRLKIVITPIAFLVAIVAVIWYIWPTAQQIIAKNDELKKNKENLSSILDKKNNVEILRGVLDKEKEKEDFVLSYLPLSRNDEKVIDAINSVATDSGSNLIKLSVVEAVEALNPVQPVDAGLSPSSTVVSGTVSADPNIVIPIPKPNTKFFTVKVDVSGKYENIKMFLDQTQKMNIFNKVSSLSITKSLSVSSETDQTSADDGILVANIEFQFGYLPQIHEENGSSSEIFAKSNIDFSPYSKIISLITKTIPVLDEGQKGKSNPFLQ